MFPYLFVTFVILVFILIGLIIDSVGSSKGWEIFHNSLDFAFWGFLLELGILVFFFKETLALFLRNNFFTAALVIALIFIGLSFPSLIGFGLKIGSLLKDFLRR